MHSSLVNWQTGAWLVTRGELTLQQGEKKPKLKQRDRDKCSADKLASKQMEPDVGRWPSAAATPDFRAVTVGRRTHRTSGRLNGWPVRYVQQRLNVYRWTSATTNDWMSNDDWDDRTSGEWTSGDWTSRDWKSDVEQWTDSTVEGWLNEPQTSVHELQPEKR